MERCTQLLTSAADNSIRSASNGMLLSISAQICQLDPCKRNDPALCQDTAASSVTASQLALWAFHSCRSRLKHVTAALESCSSITSIASAGNVNSCSASEESAEDASCPVSDKINSMDQPHNCLYNAVYQFLECCRQGAKVYLYAACPAEASSFISQGLALARQHQLTNW